MVAMPGNLEEKASSQQQACPLVLEKTLGASSSVLPPTRRRLRLMMLGCEDHPPYGPTHHTGSLFLELFVQTISDKDYAASCTWTVSITIYRVCQGEYPQTNDEWDSYDGILLPGSFSSAYDHDPWIEKLKRVLQNEVVAYRRPTLGVCFGHQILAHSFATGRATKYPEGSRGGRRAMSTTNEGFKFFGGRDAVELYYTHGDMVLDLPDCAVALAKEDGLPAQSVAYFRDPQEAIQFQSTPSVKPFAITFQAHPEYVADLGTLQRILKVMVEKGLIGSDDGVKAEKDAVDQLKQVYRHSLDSLDAAATAMGWFS